MNTQILKVTKGHFYVYLNLNLRSYGQLFVLVFIYINYLLIIPFTPSANSPSYV